MEHEFRVVDVLDKTGKIIGQKLRREIDKNKDIYHAVYILLITPEGDIVLSIIPVREDLPNLYAHHYGTTMATIRRHGETSAEAATRGISRELFIDDVPPQLIGEGMEHIEDDKYVYASLFCLRTNTPSSYSLIDIGRLEIMTPKKFTALLEVKPEKVAPTLRTLWRTYRTKLPLGKVQDDSRREQYLVDILDKQGKVISAKPRASVKKVEDIYHSIHVILVTPRGELVLSTIPVREDLPNLYAGKIGSTMATIKRVGETPLQAARRALERKLFIDDMKLVELGSHLHALEDGKKNLITAFFGIAEAPQSFSVLDIESLVLISPKQLDALVESGDRMETTAATLIAIWETYRGKFPV